MDLIEVRRVERFPMPVCTCSINSMSESSVGFAEPSSPATLLSLTPGNRFRHALGNLSVKIFGRESLFTFSGLCNLMGFVLRYVPSTVAFVGGAYALWQGYRDHVSDCEIIPVEPPINYTILIVPILIMLRCRRTVEKLISWSIV